MSRKPKLTDLARELQQGSHPEAPAPELDPNPARGERGEFLRITVTISPELLGEVKLLGLRRRARGLIDTSVSAVVREALHDLVRREKG